MGNCQAIDAAAFVIQHPNGRIERFYWPITASEVMRMNPGHYVSLIIPLPSLSHEDKNNQQQEDVQKTVRFTRVNLLRPTDTLSPGHAYRLLTSQEVMKVLRAKKHAKIKRQQQESAANLPEKLSSGAETEQKPDKENNNNQAMGHERHHPKMIPVNPAQAAMRSKSWRPSLQSISESVS